MSKEGFYKFKKKYKNFSTKIKKNIYAIADDKKNLISYHKYLKSIKISNLKFKKIDKSKLHLKKISYAIKCDEELIEQKKIIKYFNNELKKNILFSSDVKEIQKRGKKFVIKNKEYDYVINCTWQQSFALKKLNLIYENCIIPIYKSSLKEHPAYTIMDGPFFTFYPWKKNVFGLYSVKYSRLNKSKNINYIKNKFQNTRYINKIKIRKKIEIKFSEFYPDFKKNFKFCGFLTSIRTIQSNKNDARICIVENNNNFINILSGKIDHIFYAGEKVLKCLKKY